MKKILFFIFSFLYITKVFSTSDIDYSESFNHIRSNTNISGSKILIQGDMKAEFIENKDFRKPNLITITIGQKKHTLRIPVRTESLKCMKENQYDDQGNKTSEDTLKSLCFSRFVGFQEFSPSGYYLSYRAIGWESIMDILLDTRTGKSVITTDGNEFTGWAKDRKQFVYGGLSGMGTNKGLYITIKGQFPKVVQILDEDVQGGYIDDKNIYVKTYAYSDVTKTADQYYKVIDIKTLKIIFSQKIKNN